VVGQQRIDAPATLPIDFAVLVDADAIDPTHAYGLYATIVDGASTWDNRVGEPVITGGPSGIALTLRAVSPTPRRRSAARSSPAGTSWACGGRDRGTHQGRDRNARRSPGAADRQPRGPRVLDRVRPRPGRSGGDLRREGRDHRRCRGLAEPYRRDGDRGRVAVATVSSRSNGWRRTCRSPHRTRRRSRPDRRRRPGSDGSDGGAKRDTGLTSTPAPDRDTRPHSDTGPGPTPAPPRRRRPPTATQPRPDPDRRTDADPDIDRSAVDAPPSIARRRRRSADP
jgi:hypothetical protein